MTYVWLSLAFLAGAVLVAVVAVVRAARRASVRPVRLRLGLPAASVVLSGLVLFVLTAVFDNVMIAVGLMTYAAAYITGLHVGSAPLEDFAYPLAAVLLLPSLWLLLAKPAGRRQ